MNILIVDDHPIIADFYESFLHDYFSTDISVSKAFTCKQAYHYITSLQTGLEEYDYAFLDYNLPSYAEQNINSGIDIAQLLRKYCLKCKIIIITAHVETLVVYEIIKMVHPEGLATKNDINGENLHHLIEVVTSGNYYQSQTIKKSALKIWENKIMVDNNNRKIIFYLAKGYKIKDLVTVIDLPASTIQKRLTNIKKIFCISEDGNLLKELAKKGYI